MTGRTQDLLTGRSLFRIGLVLLIGAFAFFLRLSVAEGWIGPLGQLGLATAGGMAMVVVGDSLARRRPVYGNLLQGGGGAVLYLTGFAAHHRIGTLGATATTAVLAAISLGLVGLALRHRSEPLAAVGLAGAAAAPLVLGSGFDLAYLVVTLLVGATLYLRSTWRLAFVTSAAAAVGSLAIALLDPQHRIPLTLGLATTLIGVWVVSLIVARLRPDSVIETTVIPVISTLTIPILTYAGTVIVWQATLPPIGRMGVALALTALVLVGRSQVAASTVTREVHLITAALIAMVGLFDNLDHRVGVIVVVSEAAALLIMGLRMERAVMALIGALGMMGVLLFWPILAVSAADSKFDLDDLASASVVIAYLVTPWALLGRSDQNSQLTRIVTTTIGSVLVLIWPVASLRPIDTGLLTAAWLTTGLALVVGGRIRDLHLIRNAGLGLTLFSVAKLLLIDTAEVAPLGRVGLFAGAGMALLAVGYWLGREDEGHPEVSMTSPGPETPTSDVSPT